MSSESRDDSAKLAESLLLSLHVPSDEKRVPIRTDHAAWLIYEVRSRKLRSALEVRLGWGYSAMCLRLAGIENHVILELPDGGGRPDRLQVAKDNLSIYQTDKRSPLSEVRLEAAETAFPTLFVIAHQCGFRLIGLENDVQR